MKLLFTLSLFFTASLCLAQRQNVYYLKYNGLYVDTRDSADYVRIVHDSDSGPEFYDITEFFTKKGNKRLIGRSSEIDPPKYEGVCATFYPNGKRRSMANYKNGLKAGDDYEYYPNGRFYTKNVYPDNYHEGDAYMIMSNSDSLGNDQVTNGNGYYKGYDDEFTYIAEEGQVKDGKREGSWKGESRSMKTIFTETYDNGELVKGIAIGEDGKSTLYGAETKSVPPQFKGGNDEFPKFLRGNIEYPEYARAHKIQGRVRVSFVIEENGELTDMKVIKSVEPHLDEEALRVLKESPKWEPAIQFGKFIRVRYIVPINFSLANN